MLMPSANNGVISIEGVEPRRASVVNVDVLSRSVPAGDEETSNVVSEWSRLSVPRMASTLVFQVEAAAHAMTVVIQNRGDLAS